MSSKYSRSCINCINLSLEFVIVMFLWNNQSTGSDSLKNNCQRSSYIETILTVIYDFCVMNRSYCVMMSCNDPASNIAVNISYRTRKCLSPKWKKISSMKYQQSFINQSYRCGSVKVKNNWYSLQKLPHTQIQTISF